jgi:hypothetical protein
VLVEEPDCNKIAGVVEKYQVNKIASSGQSYCHVGPCFGNC